VENKGAADGLITTSRNCLSGDGRTGGTSRTSAASGTEEEAQGGGQKKKVKGVVRGNGGGESVTWGKLDSHQTSKTFGGVGFGIKVGTILNWGGQFGDQRAERDNKRYREDGMRGADRAGRRSAFIKW